MQETCINYNGVCTYYSMLTAIGKYLKHLFSKLDSLNTENNT